MSESPFDFDVFISHASKHSRYYVVVLSPNYLENAWNQFELGVALGRDEGHQILPVYFRTSPAEAREKLPLSTTRAGISADNRPLAEVARMIRDAVNGAEAGTAAV